MNFETFDLFLWSAPGFCLSNRSTVRGYYKASRMNCYPYSGLVMISHNVIQTARLKNAQSFSSWLATVLKRSLCLQFDTVRLKFQLIFNQLFYFSLKFQFVSLFVPLYPYRSYIHDYGANKTTVPLKSFFSNFPKFNVLNPTLSYQFRFINFTRQFY